MDAQNELKIDEWWDIYFSKIRTHPRKIQKELQ